MKQRMKWLALCVVVGAGCAEKDAEVAPAPTPLQVDAAVDAAPPEFKIVMGEVTIEQDAPDAAPPPKPAKKARWRPRPKPKTAVAPPKPKPRATKRGGHAAIVQTIQRHMGEVSDCYAPVATKDPTIQGRIMVQWTLSASGAPTATAILQNTLKDKSVAACIKRKARSWRFPPPEGGVSVIKYPFNLSMQ